MGASALSSTSTSSTSPRRAAQCSAVIPPLSTCVTLARTPTARAPTPRKVRAMSAAHGSSARRAASMSPSLRAGRASLWRSCVIAARFHTPMELTDSASIASRRGTFSSAESTVTIRSPTPSIGTSCAREMRIARTTLPSSISKGSPSSPGADGPRITLMETSSSSGACSSGTRLSIQSSKLPTLASSFWRTAWRSARAGSWRFLEGPPPPSWANDMILA
eukprot:4640141-Prymnesium_polylepis.2